MRVRLHAGCDSRLYLYSKLRKTFFGLCVASLNDISLRLGGRSCSGQGGDPRQCAGAHGMAPLPPQLWGGRDQPRGDAWAPPASFGALLSHQAVSRAPADPIKRIFPDKLLWEL